MKEIHNNIDFKSMDFASLNPFSGSLGWLCVLAFAVTGLLFSPPTGVSYRAGRLLIEGHSCFHIDKSW